MYGTYELCDHLGNTAQKMPVKPRGSPGPLRPSWQHGTENPLPRAKDGQSEKGRENVGANQGPDTLSYPLSGTRKVVGTPTTPFEVAGTAEVFVPKEIIDRSIQDICAEGAEPIGEGAEPIPARAIIIGDDEDNNFKDHT